MFDSTFPPAPTGPIPPRPAPFDIYPLLPMLRARAAADAVEMLATAAAENALCVKRWVLANWGANADLCDHGHPAITAALDPASPMFKFAETQIALSAVCERYRMCTGHDGLAFGRRYVAERYGTDVANCVLGRLEARTIEQEINDLLACDPDDIEPPPVEPTAAERVAAARAVADWVLSDPALSGLSSCLEALLACASDGGDPRGAATAAALDAVSVAIGGLVHDGCEVERIQNALDAWAAATGGPRITVSIGDPPDRRDNVRSL